MLRDKGKDLTGKDFKNADLKYANFYRAYCTPTGYDQVPDFRNADLRGADFRYADLEVSNFAGAILNAANLRAANFRGSDFQAVSLRRANLRGADLRGVDFRYADLTGASLQGANLRDAVLFGADLREADIGGVALGDYSIVPSEGEFIGWKSTTLGVIKLKIPADAKRVSCLTSRRCRASKVIVLDGPGCGGYSDTYCRNQVCYRKKATVVADSFDDDIRVECTHGIHFFLTKKEAEDWHGR